MEALPDEILEWMFHLLSEPPKLVGKVSHRDASVVATKSLLGALAPLHQVCKRWQRLVAKTSLGLASRPGAKIVYIAPNGIEFIDIARATRIASMTSDKLVRQLEAYFRTPKAQVEFKLNSALPVKGIAKTDLHEGNVVILDHSIADIQLTLNDPAQNGRIRNLYPVRCSFSRDKKYLVLIQQQDTRSRETQAGSMIDSGVFVYDMQPGFRLEVAATYFYNGTHGIEQAQLIDTDAGPNTLLVLKTFWFLALLDLSTRQWEWFLFHRDDVNEFAVTKSHSHVITASDDYTAGVFDIRTRKVVRKLTGHSNFVLGVSASDDERFIVTGSYDKSVRLWDFATGHCLRTFNGHTNMVWVVGIVSHVSPPLVISSGSDKAVYVWDTDTGKVVTTLAELFDNTTRTLCIVPPTKQSSTDGFHSEDWTALLGSEAKSLVQFNLRTLTTDRIVTGLGAAQPSIRASITAIPS